MFLPLVPSRKVLCSKCELSALVLGLPRQGALGALGAGTASLPLLGLGRKGPGELLEERYRREGFYLPFPFYLAPQALEDVWSEQCRALRTFWVPSPEMTQPWSPPCAFTMLWLPPVSDPPRVGDLSPGGAQAAQVSPGKVAKAHPVPRGHSLPGGSRQGLFCRAAHALGSGSRCPALQCFLFPNPHIVCSPWVPSRIPGGKGELKEQSKAIPAELQPKIICLRMILYFPSSFGTCQPILIISVPWIRFPYPGALALVLMEQEFTERDLRLP